VSNALTMTMTSSTLGRNKADDNATMMMTTTVKISTLMLKV
jgi:hypothetical protein